MIFTCCASTRGILLRKAGASQEPGSDRIREEAHRRADAREEDASHASMASTLSSNIHLELLCQGCPDALLCIVHEGRAVARDENGPTLLEENAEKRRQEVHGILPELAV
eukprot:3545426-Pleurochrysis_carterae.AAC.2